MTTSITPRDIVLWNGRAALVMSARDGWLTIDPDNQRRGPDGILPLVKTTKVTRIGSTADGWRVHSGSERPAGVGEDDLVQWFDAKGVMLDGTIDAGTLNWSAHWAPVVAYRIVHRAERAEEKPDREAEVRKVAAELRERSRTGDPDYVSVETLLDELISWAERLDPQPAPEPLKLTVEERLERLEKAAGIAS